VAHWPLANAVSARCHYVGLTGCQGSGFDGLSPPELMQTEAFRLVPVSTLALSFCPTTIATVPGVLPVGASQDHHRIQSD
jgi:hypothetical protein